MCSLAPPPRAGPGWGAARAAAAASAARCYPVSVEGQIAGAIVLPEVPSNTTDVVEILAPVNLREALKLGDGAAVTIALLQRQPEG